MRLIGEGALPYASLGSFSAPRESGGPLGGSGDGRRTDLTSRSGRNEIPLPPGRIQVVRRSVHVRGHVPASGGQLAPSPRSSPLPPGETAQAKEVPRVDQAGRQLSPAPLRANAGKDSGRPDSQAANANDRPDTRRPEEPKGEVVQDDRGADRTRADHPARPVRAVTLPARTDAPRDTGPQGGETTADKPGKSLVVRHLIEESIRANPLDYSKTMAPVHRQIGAALERVVTTLPSGTRLPSEPVLTEIFGHDRTTVREGLVILEDRGLIERLQGRGTFVAERPAEGDTIPHKKRITLQRATANMVRGRIADGTFPVGTQIPPEADLVDTLGVSRNTLRAAMQTLADEGLIDKVPGQGTFVLKKPTKLAPRRQTLQGKIVDDILIRCETGNLNPGDKLPSEWDLMGEYHVSRNTVREAMKILARRGRIEIRQGSGTYIKEPES
ncbi:MAG TPA: GntR family transcriptional regulator [Candidatus Acidoferrales bacterium]|nr:GntR family transcriptional regulator [Candidatus Acidoferrales bacterium]